MDKTNRTEVYEAKRALRRGIQEGLRKVGHARFPGARGRVPNFTGAEKAAEVLATEPRFRRAQVLLCNPELPQRPVRAAALRAGKRIYVAVSRLEGARPFLLIDPAQLEPGELWHASSIRGAMELGKPVHLGRMQRIDLVIVGAVGVAKDGARLGRGSGYSDLEYAVLRERDVIRARTPVLSTVHPIQVVDDGLIPMAIHDVSIDGFALPDRFVRCQRVYRRPRGVLDDVLDEEKLRAIPVLRKRVSRLGAASRGRSSTARRRNSK